MSDDAVFNLSVQVPKTTNLRPYKPLNNYIDTLGLSKIQQRVLF